MGGLRCIPAYALIVGNKSQHHSLTIQEREPEPNIARIAWRPPMATGRLSLATTFHSLLTYRLDRIEPDQECI